MRKIVLIATLVISLQGFSQTQAFIFAGVQANNVRYTINDVKQNTSFKIGGQAGLGLKVPFDGRLSFVPSVFYSLKGYQVDFDRSSPYPDATAINNDVTIHCVELAPLLQYDFTAEPKHFFLRIGPSLDFQLFGHEEFQTNTGSTISRSMNFDYDKYGHYSGNALGHFGYETESFFIYTQYTFGLASINNYDEGPQIRHRNIGLSAGFFLKKKK